MATTKRRKISPFRNPEDLENEIKSFMTIHKTSFVNHASRMSDYFEMCCFNYIVRFYQNRGYSVSVENLQDGKYRYKCSTQGNQENFSYFSTRYDKKGVLHEFEIHHNLAVQSSHDDFIFTTPDICVIRKEGIAINKDFYAGKKRLSYAPNAMMVTFCEAKQFTPFPELAFNFIGTVNELRPHHLSQNQLSSGVTHIAPALMISGKPNDHALRIKKSLEKRYCVNIVYDLFASTYHPFNTVRIRELTTIRVPLDGYQNNEEDLPF